MNSLSPLSKNLMRSSFLFIAIMLLTYNILKYSKILQYPKIYRMLIYSYDIFARSILKTKMNTKEKY